MRQVLLCLIVILIITSCFSSPLHSSSTESSLVNEPTNISAKCATQVYVTLCVSDVSFDDTGTHLLIEAQLTDSRLRLTWPFTPSDFQYPNDSEIFLSGKDGIRFELIDDFSHPEAGDFLLDEDQTTQLFEFPTIPSDAGPFTLHIPSIVILLPLEESIELDLGKLPGPGASYVLDADVEMLDHKVQFDEAEVDNQLQLHVFTAPIDLGDHLILRWLNAGLPEGWSSGIGPGNKYDFEARIQHLWFPIENSGDQSISGVISIPLHTAVLYLYGPFDMIVDGP